MRLRPYQQEAVDSIYKFFAEKEEGNPVVAMPTGTGKSLVIAGFIEGVIKRWPGQRIMMLTHVKELIEQNAEKMQQVWPQAPLGIFSAGLKSKTTGMPITFAGIQSAARAALMFGRIDLVIIDECHLVSPNAQTSYQNFIAILKEINPSLRVIGLSATPYRLGLGMITDGGIFTDVCYDITGMSAFNRLLDEGYLSPLIPKRTALQLDVSGVGSRGGEFIESELQQAVNKDEITRAALTEALVATEDRCSGLVYTTGIDHTESVTAELIARGELATCVHSKIPAGERDQRIADFRAGKYRIMVNAGILTTGFDHPPLDFIIILRPTSSTGLWVQILGRGTRPLYAPGYDLSTSQGRLDAMAASNKQNCLVLDFAGNSARLGPINDPVIPKKSKGGGDAPIKICETHKLHGEQEGCGAYNHASTRVCCNPECEGDFIFETKLETRAATQDLIVRDEPITEWFGVDRITYAVHKKQGRPDSLKVSYFSGLRRFTEWVTAWHPGNVQHTGEKWWNERTAIPLPGTAALACDIANELAQPTQILVWTNKKYPEVLNHEF